MSVSQTNAPRPLPMPLILGGSVFAVGHLLAIGLLALAAPSGPWPMGAGSSDSPGPQFAGAITSNFTYPHYLQHLRMTHNYHFNSNRPAPFAAYFEVHLKDDQGTVFKKLKFPDDKANFWVRHRESILAQGLAEDQPVQLGTEVIAAPGKAAPTIEIWDKDKKDNNVLKLTQKLQNEVPRNPPPVRPSEWSKLLAQSYMRYLCKEYGAHSAELVRHSRELIMPQDMFVPRPDGFNELQSHFGEYRRED
jgi:hypothetical protein